MPDNKDILRSAKKTDEFLESSIKHHRTRLLNSIAELEKNIVNAASEFKTTDGLLLGPRVNLKLAQKIHSQLKTLFNETYGTEAKSVISGFNKTLRYIKKDFESLDVAMDYTSVDKDMVETLKKSSWGNFNQFGLQAQEKLVDVMYNSILGKTTFASMAGQFSGILTGFKDKRGKSMSQYADLYAHDAIMDFHNQVHLKKANDLGFTYFLYYGNLINTSRPFCRSRVMKIFSKEEIEGWDFPWKGKSGPALSNRGGYNCRHHWRPVRKGWVDEKSLEGLQGEPLEPVAKKGEVNLMTSADNLSSCIGV